MQVVPSKAQKLKLSIWFAYFSYSTTK